MASEVDQRRWPGRSGSGCDARAQRHQLSTQDDGRSYSPTALENYSKCPYRFMLQAIFRLEPREEAEALEAIDPLTRGSLTHEIQFEILSQACARRMLPVTPANLEAAQAELGASRR